MTVCPSPVTPCVPCDLPRGRLSKDRRQHAGSEYQGDHDQQADGQDADDGDGEGACRRGRSASRDSPALPDLVSEAYAAAMPVFASWRRCAADEARGRRPARALIVVGSSAPHAA